MKVYSLAVGIFQTNCYIIETEQKNAIVIDAGAEPQKILSLLNEHGLTAKILLFTHGHFDHIGAASVLKEQTGARTVVPALDRERFLAPWEIDGAFFPSFAGYEGQEPDRLIADGDTISLDDVTLTAMATPGHTPGSMVFYTNDVAFTGDTLFMGSVGRTDLPGGDMKTLMQSLLKFDRMEEQTRILSGHGVDTVLSFERKTNPYLQKR